MNLNFIITASYTTFSNVQVQNCPMGIRLNTNCIGITISNCKFFECSTGLFGSGVHNTTVINSTFSFSLNPHDSSSASMHFSSSKNIWVTSTKFLHNVVTIPFDDDKDKAIALEIQTSELVHIYDCEFFNNTKPKAGAVKVENSTIYFGNSTFTHNIATQSESYSSSGAIFLFNSTALVQNCNFIDNSGGQGGSIAISSSTVTIQYSVFQNNSARLQGIQYEIKDKIT